MQGQGASPRRRLALLIDAENIADAGLVRRLLERLENHGEVRIRVATRLDPLRLFAMADDDEAIDVC